MSKSADWIFAEGFFLGFGLLGFFCLRKDHRYCRFSRWARKMLAWSYFYEVIDKGCIWFRQTC